MAIYKLFSPATDVKTRVETVTTGIWSGDTGSLSAFYTSSAQKTSAAGKYYVNVYSTNPAVDTSAEVQFALAYGHIYGSGSVTYLVDENTTFPTKAIYSQYKSLLLSPLDSKFSFVNSSNVAEDSNDIYVVNLSRSRVRESVDPGNWQLTLSGSNGLRTFIDDSGYTLGEPAAGFGRVYKIVSGALNIGSAAGPTIASATSPNGKGYGLFYPDRGILIFNPTALGSALGNVVFTTGSTDIQNANLSGSLLQTVDAYNHYRLYGSIVGGAKFECRRTEKISTQHFFVRINNTEFNYSNNPTFSTASTGRFTQASFEENPQTYITTLGLYNSANELIAVAKTSQPIPKSFDREALIKIKLSY